MELSRGTVGDRPWAQLFATLAFADGARELVVETGARVHRVAFADQTVIGASSPLASDSALRVMGNYGVITPAMMPTVASRVAAMPSADPIEVLAAMAQLSPETALLMRRRTIAVAATRIFALGTGTYRVMRDLTLQITPGAALDVRALIYEGVRTHLTDEQLAGTIARHGKSFVLRPEVSGDLPRFGFSPVEMSVVDELRAGASLADLAFRHPEVGTRGVHTIVTALLAAHAIGPTPRPPATLPRASAEHPAQMLGRSSDQLPAQRISDRVPTQRTTGQFSTQVPVTGRFVARTGNTGGFDVAPAPSIELAEEPGPARTTGSQRAVSQGETYELAEQPRARTSRTFVAAEPQLEPGQQALARQSDSTDTFELAEESPPRAASTTGTCELPFELAEPPRSFTTKPPTTGVFAVPGRADLPATDPGVSPRPSTTGAPSFQRSTGQHGALDLQPAPAQRTSGGHAAIVRPTPPVHPALDRPAPHPTNPDPAFDARPVERTPASHPALARPLPLQRLGSPPIAAVPEMRVSENFSITIRPSSPTLQGAVVSASADGGLTEVMAREHYDRGIALLDHDVEAAIVELDAAARISGDVDHEAMLAWAQFAAAPNNEPIANATKTALAKAVYQSKQPSLAHFYLGRMERMLGRDREALSHFKTVVALIPRHVDALAEVRSLEARLFPKK